MNPKFEPILKIMENYDKSSMYTNDRIQFGIQLDDIGCKLKQRDCIKICCEYEKRCVAK